MKKREKPFEALKTRPAKGFRICLEKLTPSASTLGSLSWLKPVTCLFDLPSKKDLVTQIQGYDFLATYTNYRNLQVKILNSINLKNSSTLLFFLKHGDTQEPVKLN